MRGALKIVGPSLAGVIRSDVPRRSRPSLPCRPLSSAELNERFDWQAGEEARSGSIGSGSGSAALLAAS